MIPFLEETVIISDPLLCNTKNRQIMENVLRKHHDRKIEWIFFENDPKKCLINVEYRNDGRKVENFDI